MNVDSSIVNVCTFGALHEFVHEYYSLQKNGQKLSVSGIHKKDLEESFYVSRCGLIPRVLHPDRDYGIILFKYLKSNSDTNGKNFIVSSDDSLDCYKPTLDLLSVIRESIFHNSFKTDIEEVIRKLRMD